MLTAKVLAEYLKKHKLLKAADRIQAAALSSIAFTAKKGEEDAMPLGASKLGGRPDLPAGQKWPEWKGVPMAFLGQIALKDVARYDVDKLLPRSGLLLFFCDSKDSVFGYDPKDKGGWSVVYCTDKSETLKRTELPKALDKYHTYPACRAGFRKELTLPPGMSLAMERLGLDDEQRNRYYDMESELGKLRQEHGARLHQLLGHPYQIQTDMAVMSQLVTNGIYMGDGDPFAQPRARELVEGAGEWRLLLQIDSDDETGMQWSDNGMLYFWLRKDDLAAKAFDNCWFALQCS
jgi:uncharacterized protein YwqG